MRQIERSIFDLRRGVPVLVRGRDRDTLVAPLEGLTDETMIIFTSDNGGLYKRYDYQPAADDLVATQSPLRGEKGTLFEGGVRVPLIIKYPPMTRAGTVSHEPAISHDFYPTFIELAGGQLPSNQPTVNSESTKAQPISS